MTALYHLNENIAHLLEGFLESAVPLIAGLAEVIGLFIIVTSLVKATYHYVRATFFRDRYDFHHEMSTGLTTALEFLMSAEIAKTFLLQNLEYCFEKLFGFGHGQGYPKERVEPEQRNKKILDGVRAATFKPLIECLKSIDQDLLKGAIAGEKFSELFFASCKDEELAAYIKSLLA